MGSGGLRWLTKKSGEGGLGDRVGVSREELPLPLLPAAGLVGSLSGCAWGAGGGGGTAYSWEEEHTGVLEAGGSEEDLRGIPTEYPLLYAAVPG